MNPKTAKIGLDVNNQRQFGLYFTNVFVILLEYILILIVAYLNLPLGICTNNNTIQLRFIRS